jgi:polysaccharide chain length determinant protein (PEP-CTERM system associated)
MPDRYRSEAVLLLVPQRVPEAFVKSTVTRGNQDALQSMMQEILSRTQLERIILDFDLYADRRPTAAMQAIVDAMRQRDIEIRPMKGDAFRLGFVAENPDTAMRVVERLVSLFIVETSLDRAKTAEGTDRFLEAQLEDARRKLIDNEARLSEYRRRHNGELPTQVDANLRGLDNTETQLQTLADSLNRDRDRQLTLERAVKDANLELVDARMRAVVADTPKQTAGDQLGQAEAALEEMRRTLTERHPDVITMKQTIGDLRKRAEAERGSGGDSTNVSAELRRGRLDELQDELSALGRQIVQKTAEEERLRAVLLDYQRRIEGAPTREAELASLTRDYDTLQQTYRGLLSKKQESAIAANLERQQTAAHFKVLDPARLPEQPFKPNRLLLYAIGVLGGIGIGVLFAVVLECFDRTLRTPDDVRAVLGLPVLATVALVRSGPTGPGRASMILSVGSISVIVATLAWQFWN